MKNTEIIDETITWYKVENKMTASQAEAPYLGAIQPKGSVGFEDFVKGVKEDGCSESELEIRRVMTKHEELMKSYVAQNYKIYCPFGIAGVHITKSFPAQDAPFNPAVNEAILALQTNAETRNALAGVTLNPTFHVRKQNPSGCWGFACRSSLHSRFRRVGSFA